MVANQLQTLSTQYEPWHPVKILSSGSKDLPAVLEQPRHTVNGWLGEQVKVKWQTLGHRAEKWWWGVVGAAGGGNHLPGLMHPCGVEDKRLQAAVLPNHVSPPPLALSCRSLWWRRASSGGSQTCCRTRQWATGKPNHPASWHTISRVFISPSGRVELAQPGYFSSGREGPKYWTIRRCWSDGAVLMFRQKVCWCLVVVNITEVLTMLIERNSRQSSL